MSRGETITMHTPGALVEPADWDDQGNPVRGEPTDSTIPGCRIAPGGVGTGQEAERRMPWGQYVVTGYQVIAPAGTTIETEATFTIRGVPGWQMEGEVSDWRSQSSGARRGVMFKVRRGS